MTERKCRHHVTGDGWHFHECGRPAKYVYVYNSQNGVGISYLCGMHSRTERKYSPNMIMTIEEYEKCNQN